MTMYEWREGKTLRADIAVAKVNALVEDEAGNEREVEVEVGVPVIVHKDEGVVWTSDDPAPVSPLGFRIVQIGFLKLMRQWRKHWPESVNSVDWGICFSVLPSDLPEL